MESTTTIVTYAVLAVQGTNSDEVLSRVGLPVGHDYMSFVEAEFGDHGGVVVCRTGYTGERGYELIVRNDIAGPLWDALLAAGDEFGMLACGLGARDTLRTEMGYPLHGQDISLDVTPNQARLGWAVGWRKEAFWGRDALLAEKEAGPRRTLRGLIAVGRGIPRPGMGCHAGSRRAAVRHHLGDVLAHPPQGHRAGAGRRRSCTRTRSSGWTSAAVARSSRASSSRSSTRRSASPDVLGRAAPSRRTLQA